MQVTTAGLREGMNEFGGLLERLESNTLWVLSFPFRKPACCFHGGAFFEAIGPHFETLERSGAIINADVLDAATVVKRCRERGLFVRDAAAMGSQLCTHALRIAVKDAPTNRRIVAILSEVLRGNTDL